MAEEDKPEGVVRISEAPPPPKIKYTGTDQPILLVDSAVAQNSVDLGMFYLSFFQNDFRMEMPEEFSATCIGRFGITPQGMANLISLLRTNFDRFQRALQDEYKKALQAQPEETKE